MLATVATVVSVYVTGVLLMAVVLFSAESFTVDERHWMMAPFGTRGRAVMVHVRKVALALGWPFVLMGTIRVNWSWFRGDEVTEPTYTPVQIGAAQRSQALHDDMVARERVLFAIRYPDRVWPEGILQYTARPQDYCPTCGEFLIGRGADCLECLEELAHTMQNDPAVSPEVRRVAHAFMNYKQEENRQRNARLARARYEEEKHAAAMLAKYGERRKVRRER